MHGHYFTTVGTVRSSCNIVIIPPLSRTAFQVQQRGPAPLLVLEKEQFFGEMTVLYAELCIKASQELNADLHCTTCRKTNSPKFK